MVEWWLTCRFRHGTSGANREVLVGDVNATEAVAADACRRGCGC